MARSWAFIQKHSVLTYFVLTIGLSWGTVLLLTGELGPMYGADWRSDPKFMLGVLGGPVFAAAVGILMTWLISGREGLRDLRTRLLRWRVGMRWYALALLLAPLSTIGVAVLLDLSLSSPEFLPAIFTTSDPVGLLLPGLVAGLFVGCSEEVGWTGFVIPRLRLRYGVLATGLIVGIPWGAWHFPLFRESGSFSELLLLILLLVKLFAWLPAYRVLMVRVYDHTNSLSVAMLMHASASATSVILATSGLSVTQSLTSLLVWAALLWAIVAAVAVASRRQPSRHPLSRSAA